MTTTMTQTGTSLTEKDLATIQGGALPALAAVPVGIKVAGYVTGGLIAGGIAAWGYLN